MEPVTIDGARKAKVAAERALLCSIRGSIDTLCEETGLSVLGIEVRMERVARIGEARERKVVTSVEIELERV